MKQKDAKSKAYVEYISDNNKKTLKSSYETTIEYQNIKIFLHKLLHLIGLRRY